MRIKYFVPGVGRDAVMAVTEAKSPKDVPVAAFNKSADVVNGFYYVVSVIGHRNRCCKCWSTLGELLDEVKHVLGGYFTPSCGSAPYCD